MREIIRDVLSRYHVGHLSQDELKYDLRKACIKKEERVLSLDMTLNFVMPLDACHDIKDRVGQKLGDMVSGVEINFSYDHILLTEEEIIELFIPHMIEIVNGGYGGITKAVQKDKFIFDGKNLTIYAAGDFTVDLLNSHVAKQFKTLLKSVFNIDTEVIFKNDEDNFQKSVKAFREVEDEDIKRSLEEYKKHLKCKTDNVKNESTQKSEPSQPKERWSGRRREKEEPAKGGELS